MKHKIKQVIALALVLTLAFNITYAKKVEANPIAVARFGEFLIELAMSGSVGFASLNNATSKSIDASEISSSVIITQGQKLEYDWTKDEWPVGKAVREKINQAWNGMTNAVKTNLWNLYNDIAEGKKPKELVLSTDQQKNLGMDLLINLMLENVAVNYKSTIDNPNSDAPFTRITPQQFRDIFIPQLGTTTVDGFYNIIASSSPKQYFTRYTISRTKNYFEATNGIWSEYGYFYVLSDKSPIVGLYDTYARRFVKEIYSGLFDTLQYGTSYYLSSKDDTGLILDKYSKYSARNSSFNLPPNYYSYNVFDAYLMDMLNIIFSNSSIDKFVSITEKLKYFITDTYSQLVTPTIFNPSKPIAVDFDSPTNASAKQELTINNISKNQPVEPTSLILKDINENITLDSAIPSTNPLFVHIPVESITNLTNVATVGVPLVLDAIVSPSESSYKGIEWSLVDAGNTGATINGNVLSTTKEGNAKLRATIKDGVSKGTDFSQDFDITVNLAVLTPITSVFIDNVTPKVDDILNVNVVPLNATVTYEWKVLGEVVSTVPTYKVREEDIGKSIVVTITGVQDFSGEKTSTPTAEVEESTPTTEPDIKGNIITDAIVNAIKFLFTVEDDYWPKKIEEAKVKLFGKLDYTGGKDTLLDSGETKFSNINGTPNIPTLPPKESTFVNFKFLEDSLPTFRRWIDGFFAILLFFYNINQVLFLIRGTHLFSTTPRGGREKGG